MVKQPRKELKRWWEKKVLDFRNFQKSEGEKKIGI